MKVGACTSTFRACTPHSAAACGSWYMQGSTPPPVRSHTGVAMGTPRSLLPLAQWQQATTALQLPGTGTLRGHNYATDVCDHTLQSQLRGRWPSLSGSCVGSGLCRVVAMGESSVPVAVVCTSVLGALLFVLGLKTSLRRQVRDRQLRAYHDACADTCPCPCACVRACVHVCARDCTRAVHNSTGCSEKPGQGGSGESCCNEPCAWQHQ